MLSVKAGEYIKMAVTNSTHSFRLSFLSCVCVCVCVCVDVILFLCSYSRFETVYVVGTNEFLP